MLQVSFGGGEELKSILASVEIRSDEIGLERHAEQTPLKAILPTANQIGRSTKMMSISSQRRYEQPIENEGGTNSPIFTKASALETSFANKVKSMQGPNSKNPSKSNGALIKADGAQVSKG